MRHREPVTTTTVTIKTSSLLNATNTAAYLSITLRTLFRWINKGKIQPIKIDGHLFFARDGLKKLKTTQNNSKNRGVGANNA